MSCARITRRSPSDSGRLCFATTSAVPGGLPRCLPWHVLCLTGNVVCRNGPAHQFGVTVDEGPVRGFHAEVTIANCVVDRKRGVAVRVGVARFEVYVASAI